MLFHLLQFVHNSYVLLQSQKPVLTQSLYTLLSNHNTQICILRQFKVTVESQLQLLHRLNSSTVNQETSLKWT